MYRDGESRLPEGQVTGKSRGGGGGGEKLSKSLEDNTGLYRMVTKKICNGKRSYKSHETLRKMTKVIGFCEQLTNCAQLLYERDFLCNFLTKTEKKVLYLMGRGKKKGGGGRSCHHANLKFGHTLVF